MTELQLPQGIIELTVPFYDVDSMDIVWHGNYLKYFEDARCCLLDNIDYNYLTMRESGYGWPVVDVRVKYIQPALFNRRIRIIASLEEWEVRLKIQYRILDAETGEVLTKGYSVQVAVDLASNEMCFATPDILREKLEQYSASVGDRS
ncbi:thioesterase family protein [Marinimicrobium sp. ABcell2]|uniref:acyl-CoA thioesterase n=1 Tax=Marinimicrobium sp. ABcell2 TaxID=3069751 RepID=UPI0027B53F5C|nr:acyl-CoA thioesterase [Marinimicrobium sp. ABcell2]MDQ2076969.1 acyl-CoA thioesterase [Marinimicrobium sp. ABcell2]